MKKEDELGKILWDYQLMGHKLQRAHAIIALGSHDIRVGEYAAKLFLDGWAPLLVFSGGIGRLTEKFPKPEAEVFADVAVRMGVPREKIIIENKSTNTGENVKFTKALLDEKGVNPQKVILVHKPYMERRTYATFKKQIRDVEIIVTSPPTPYKEYDLADRSKEDKLHILVGDMQRIKLYAERGFMVPQEIPKEVWGAYEQLVAMGYTRHLIK